jgi:hypothetical protein
MKNVSDKSLGKNQNTHFSSENRAVFEITRENVVEPDRSQMTVQNGAWALHVG